MLDETRTIECDAELVQAQRAVVITRRTRAKARQNNAAPAKMDVPPARDIILRLIELIKQV